MYIVNSPDLAVAVQRNSKTLSFSAYAVKLAARVCGLSSQATEILADNVGGEKGPGGFSATFNGVVHSKLALGPALEQLFQVTLPALAASVDELATRSAAALPPEPMALTEWLSHTITIAASDAVYGPGNPLRDRATEQAFWDLDAGITSLAISPLPELLAPKAVAGRRVVVDAITKYLKSGDQAAASDYLQARYTTCFQFGISLEDVARMDIGNLSSLNSNTVPAAFWMVVYIFSTPTLLDSLRRELEKVLVTTLDNSDGTTKRTLDITTVKEKCPMFVSTFQEVLRLRALGATIRLVLQDTILQDRHLLKKDGVVMIPAPALHADAAIWGPNATNLDPYRFVKRNLSLPQAETAAQNLKAKIPNGAFRVFGGGTSLCPGRHFAVTEVLCLVALLILRFELKPEPTVEGGANNWRLPAPTTRNMAAAIPFPEHDVSIYVSTRKGWEKGSWQVQASDLRGKFDVANVTG